MSFAKLFSSITESSLWSEPKEVRLLFVSMLARADATGFVDASIPGLERLANLIPEEVRNALSALEGPDPHSKNPANEGRRILKVPGGWMILNYEEYRNRRGDQERRDYMRDYMREYRRKLNVNAVNRSKPPLAQAEAEAEADKERVRASRFIPPTLDQMKLHGTKIGLPDDETVKCHAYYESNGWRVGRNPMKSWPAAMIHWRSNYQNWKSNGAKTHQRHRGEVDRNAGTANEGRAKDYAALRPPPRLEV
jgi:hypothetical protein